MTRQQLEFWIEALDSDPFAEALLEVGWPLLAMLPPVPDTELVSELLSFVVATWNAHALATSSWQQPSQLARMEAEASCPDSLQLHHRMYRTVAERRRATHRDDARVVAEWAVRRGQRGNYLFECTARIRAPARATSRPARGATDDHRRSCPPPMG